MYQIIKDFNYLWKMEDSQTLIMQHFDFGRLQTKNRILHEIL